MSGNYIGHVVEDEETGELLLEFPVELLNQMGWDEGTMLEWMIEEENVVLKEKEDGRETKTESV
jgi:hypothetical protein